MAGERLAKNEIAAQVAQRTGTPKAQANRMVDAMLDVMQDELAKGSEIRITGFGSWRVVETKARTGRNPRTGQPLDIKAGKRVAFSPGARLADMVRGSGKPEPAAVAKAAPAKAASAKKAPAKGKK